MVWYAAEGTISASGRGHELGKAQFGAAIFAGYGPMI